MKDTLILITICFLTFGCCTKKDCSNEYSPEIIFKFEGFSNSDLSKVSIILLDANLSEKIDSVTYTNWSNMYQIYIWTFGNRKIDIKDYSYIIKTNISADTIFQVKYERHYNKVKCNSCFPIGDGSATVSYYTGFSFMHEQIEYFDKDTLIIKNNLAQSNRQP